jgi:4-diphosphocytidyl-2-C-methyl-D-erythritol kinase
MTLECISPCKVNLLLNIISRRADGFHQLETVMHPVAWHDTLRFERLSRPGIILTCSHPAVPANSTNLVHRAASAFLAAAPARNGGVKIRLEKRIPIAAGLGGGSGNAAVTLRALNELFGHPLSAEQLQPLAAALGSDVPFFLQPLPALGTGRGEIITPLQPFPALRGTFILLVHPGFGVSTAWAYQALTRYPEATSGREGRAAELISLLQAASLERASKAFFNSLEIPVLHKYPLLKLYQEFLLENGASAALMSGSGSTTFALFSSHSAAAQAREVFRGKFGRKCWMALVSLG